MIEGKTTDERAIQPDAETLEAIQQRADRLPIVRRDAAAVGRRAAPGRLSVLRRGDSGVRLARCDFVGARTVVPLVLC